MPPPARTARADQKRARAEAARLAALRKQRRRRLQWAGVIAAAVVAAIAIVTSVVLTNHPSTPIVPAARGQQASGWGLPADPSAAAARAGLPMLGQEMLDVHYHAHLDVIVRGQQITVPAQIGIDVARQQISALHTHDASGVVHIESSRDVPFTLGQLFTEWGQTLTAHQVGPDVAATGEQVRVYRNGTLVAGDPASLKFTAHDEIVVWLGPAGQQPQVPSSYTFPNGE